jgi:type IV pilus assembly protein PilY1
MKNLKNVGGAWRTKRAPGWLLAACIAAVLPLTSHAVPESPAQKPLTSREGGSTKPNIILTIDESGSMGFQYLPEGTFKVGTYSVTFPQSTTLLMHPDDPRNPSVAGIGVTVPYGGIPLADVSNTTNVYQRQMRSGDVNKQYYDPRELYLPWMNVDGTRMANASFNAVRWNPLVTTGRASPPTWR